MSESLSGIVVAAGISSRFQKSLKSGLNIRSKAFVQWEEKPLYLHTLCALSVLPLQKIALVIRPEDEAEIRSTLEASPLPLNIEFAYGGRRRQDSVRSGLEKLSPTEKVFVHDAARPFLSSDMLWRLYEASKKERAVIPVQMIVETLKETDGSGQVVKTHDRTRFVRVQTPQFFVFDDLKLAHEKWAESDREFTDDAAMLEALGISVKCVAGEPQNIKVTTAEDLKGVWNAA